MSVTAAAICAAWNMPAMAAAPGVNTLPTGGVITAGTATIAQNGNTLNINQSSSAAIGNFTSFSIGANAVVDIRQTNAANAFLARVTGSDPTQIYGLLKSNGTVMLVNQNGLMVGPGGVVDVARFIGSTLNIRDSDFLAGRLNFTDDGHAGNIDNQGTIKSATGGSVYLIGANVANNGIIHSPNGEVLLAAGQTVQLVDTATPGVTVCVTGAAGSVTNLGAITAEAGRIGIAAGLVTNSGNINASSVVSEGGRIFLRASQKLTTTASSKITADGITKGGSVVLYSDGAAFIDGDVSARGAPGLGGFVETSGKTSLDVVKAPDVGTGGEWLIDPYDLTVVATGTAAVSNSGYVITSTGSSATIEAGTIVTQLNQGNSVTLTTGAGGAANGGNITVNAAINKTAGSASALTLNADNNILINADITSTGTYGLSLNLNSNYQGATTGDHTVQVTSATITPNTGIINVNEGVAGSGNGKIALNAGATIDLNVGSTLNAASLNISAGATIKSNYSTSVHLTSLKNAGEVNISNSAITTGALDNQVGGLVKLTNMSGALGGLTNAGTLNLTSVFQGGGITSGDITNTGTLTLSNGSTLNAGTLNNLGSTTLNASTLNVNGLTNAVGASVTLSDSALSASDIVRNAGTFITTNSTINTVNGMTNMVSGVLTMNYLSKISSGSFNNQGLLNAYGSAGYVTFENGFTNSGLMNLKGSIMANSSATNAQGGTLNLGAAGEATTVSGSGLWGNDGTLNILGAGNEVTLGGTLMNNQTGTMLLSGTGTFLNAGQFSNSGIVTLGSGGSVTVGGSVSNSGSLLLSGANLASNGFSNEEGGTVSGTGSITVGGGSGVFTNNGILSPGGDNAVGSLSILGNLMLGNKGTLKLDFSSATNYDKITVLGSTLGLGGTLITKLLDTYRPAVGTTFTPIAGATSSSGSFRYVEGDIVTSGGVKNMIKAGYNLEGGQSGIDALRLTMSAPEEITYTGGTESQWGDIYNWTSRYIPTAIDSIIIPTGRSAVYSGVRPESLEKITVSSGGSFGMTAGDLTVNTIRSEGNFGVAGGALTLVGTGRLYSLSLSGTLNGGSSSILNVTDSFQQYGGSINSAGDVALSQAEGDLFVGSITARNLALEAQTGSVGQQDTALHVTKQLLTSSATGTTLTSSNNRIAAFAGNNRVSGDIMLVNNLEATDTSVVKINGVSNANGNINIVNTGGAATSAIGSDADFLGSIPTESGTPISAAVRLATLGINTSGLMSVAGTGSSVNLETHSPLTIGAGGVSATGNINLTAGNSGSASDNLVVNGVIASTGGNIALLAGNNMSINANITTAAPGTALFTVTNGVLTYAPGVSITDASGTIVPVAVVVNQVIASSAPEVKTKIAEVTKPGVNETDKNVATPQVTKVNLPPTMFTAASAPVSTPANTQTTGGTQGTFGGDDTGTSTPATGGTANTAKKPLPVCT